VFSLKMLAVKFALTPFLIALATLAARRWGASVGGWLAGLPLTSGPVSVFLAFEQGRAFAAGAAVGTLLGLVSVAVFCWTYALASRKVSWIVSAPLALAAYAVVAWVLNGLSLSPWAATGLALGAITLSLGIVGSPQEEFSKSPAPNWDLPLRMILATAIVLVLTGTAASMGAQLSGVLSPFPLFAGIMAIFTHRIAGGCAAQRLLRGVLIGSFGFASFFVVVAYGLTRGGLVVTYSAATISAVIINIFTLFTLTNPRRTT
jgi:hypothetical protein